MNKKYNCFALLFCLCLSFAISISAQTKIDWKQIKNIPKKLEFEDLILNHLIFNSAYQPVMDSAHQGAIYYDNQLERLRVYENGEWRDLAVTIASDSIGAPLVILGYLQASDIYASKSAYIGKDINVKGNINGSGTANLNSLKVYKTFKVPTTASTTLGVGSIYYDTTANKLKVLNSNNQWEVVSINVDTALSATSTNPVENRVIYNKFDNFEANVALELQQTLLDAYNYANGIATQAYNYTDAVATNTKNYADNVATGAYQAGKQYSYNVATSAYQAARQYADTQLLVIDGRINTLNTNLLASLTQGLTDANASSTLYASSAVDISEGYTNTIASNTEAYARGLATQTLNAAASYTLALRDYVDSQDLATLASATKLFVSDVATSTVNGTISVTKNGSTTNVAIKGLGDAAYANVASFTPQSSSTPPSNPYLGQTYFDTVNNCLVYWNGTTWVSLKEVNPSNLFTMTNTTIQISGDYQEKSEIIWEKNSSNLVLVQVFGWADTGTDSVGVLYCERKLDLTKPYSCVATRNQRDNNDPSVCVAIEPGNNEGTGTTFTYRMYDNDGSDTRAGTIYYFIQGFALNP